MQIQTARVSLAACLVAATAAAQGTLGTSSPLAYELPRLGHARFQPDGDADAAEFGPAGAFGPVGRSRGTAAERLPLRSEPSADIRLAPTLHQPQSQDRPHGPYQLFQQIHGDFMARMERYRPQAEFGFRYAPDQSLKRDPGHYDQYTSYANIAWRWNMWPDGYLLFGGYYEGRQYEFSNMGERGNGGADLNDETLHVAALNLGFGWFLDENLLLQVESRPGYYSDLDGGMHTQDFDLPSRALFTYRASDNFFFKLGVRYNQIFQDALWLPLIGFSWDFLDGGGNASQGARPAGGWRLDVLLPEHAEVSYWPTASTSFMAGAEIIGARYSVRAPFGQREDEFRNYVNIQEVICYAGILHRFDDIFSLRARAGMVVAGDTFWTNGNESFTPVRGALDQGLWAEVSFGFDF
jgi:hypothetical protein